MSPHERARTPGLAATAARWLVSDGREETTHATAWFDAGETTLAVLTALRKRGLSRERAAAVVDAALARRRARDDWPLAEQMIATKRALEQASHPAVSAWRAERFRGVEDVVDAGAGVGGDTIALAREAASVLALDRSEARLVMLGHNADVHGVDAAAAVCDLTRPILSHVNFVHADPSRRVEGRRVTRLADYQPSVAAMWPLFAAAKGGALVVSPGVDLHDPDLPDGELEFVQLGSSLMEGVVWTGSLARSGHRSATVIADRTVHRAARGAGQLPTGAVGEWLLEPAPAAVRARLHDDLGREIGAWRLAERRALLTTDEEPEESPWWRAARVEAVLPLRPRAVKAWLRERDTAPIELVLHGVDVEVDAWWRELGAPPRAWGGRVIHLVRLDDGGSCIVTSAPIGTEQRQKVVPHPRPNR